MKICSHTLVKNGMPFIEPVLRQVIPFMNRCLVTISISSNDGTDKVLRKLQEEFPDKVFVDTEDVREPGELTIERQKQIDQTTEDWVLFLDDDDYWPKESLKEMIGLLKQDVDAYASAPFQLVDKEYYEPYWSANKWFTKWFKNDPDVHYQNPWPRDLIYKGEEVLYWKKNPRVPKCLVPFFHLSQIKPHSFRKEAWASEYAHKDTGATKFPINIMTKYEKDIERIFSYVR